MLELTATAIISLLEKEMANSTPEVRAFMIKELALFAASLTKYVNSKLIVQGREHGD